MPVSSNRLQRFLKGKEDKAQDPAADPGSAANDSALAKTQAYLEQIRQKMERLAEDFAAGRVNTTQFQELYAHYQQERRVIEETLDEAPEAAAWRATVASEEGESVIIRRRHAARILGYAIYLNTSAAPLRVIGKYDIDDQLAASMLDGFRPATEKQPDQQIRGVELEDSRWVEFVPGRYTVLSVLFSTEPARAQLGMLRDLQTHFEQANQKLLAKGVTDPSQLVFPHAAVFE